MCANSSLQKMTTFGPDVVAAQETGPIFWGEISPCEHLVQIYRENDVFLDALDGFVYGGLVKDDGVIVIATPDHLAALAHRMDSRGIDVAAASARDQYIALDAAETLAKFMVPLGGMQWPDERRFDQVVTEVIQRARDDGKGGTRRVRAFGEMVALLWQQGNCGATVRLEYLWHDFCKKNAFCLFCAYPRAYFTQNAEESIQQICDAHSRVVPG